MFPDAFTIERLATELNDWLAQSTLKDIFSTSKTDLYFVFSDKKGFKIQFFQGQAFFQFPGVEFFPTKNRMAQFSVAHSQVVVSVNAHPNSRSFDILLSNNQRIVFKLFGKFSNVILFDKNPSDIFCINFQKDLQTPFSIYANSGSVINHAFHNWQDFEKAHRWFGIEALSYLENSGYFVSENREKTFDKFNNQYLRNQVSILKKTNDLFQLSGFPDSDAIGKYPKIMDAFNDFTRLFIGAESFKNKKQSQLSNLEKQLHNKDKLFLDLQKSLEAIKHKRSYSEIGNLIMANLHSIHIGTAQVEVFDFYNNAKTVLKIKAEITPQQNAALFYQKAKNQVKEVEFKQKSLEAVFHQIKKLELQIEKLKEADDSKKLKVLDKSNNHLNKSKGNGLDSGDKEKSFTLPYRAYKIGDYDILVGKNSKANDELISKYASKNDLWFHAKDVSGSHVVIKNPSSKPIPAPVIEQVASLAAWYSKAKSNKLASVIYTLRKFVRKPKGSPPGQVIVERETGILVEPNDLRF